MDYKLGNAAGLRQDFGIFLVDCQIWWLPSSRSKQPKVKNSRSFASREDAEQAVDSWRRSWELGHGGVLPYFSFLCLCDCCCRLWSDRCSGGVIAAFKTLMLLRYEVLYAAPPVLLLPSVAAGRMHTCSRKMCALYHT